METENTMIDVENVSIKANTASTTKTLLVASVGSILAITALAIWGMTFANGNGMKNASRGNGSWQAIQQRLQDWTGLGSGAMMRGAWKQGKGMGFERGVWLGWRANPARGGMNWFGNQNTAIQAALAANDYDAFVTAWNSIEHKRADVTLPTKEEFADRVAQYASRESIQTAIANNDYNAFVTAWNAHTNKPSHATLPTQTQFAQIVAQHQAMTTTQQ